MGLRFQPPHPFPHLSLPDLDGAAPPAGPADPAKPPDGGLYPHLFWMPSGRVMVAGPNQADSWFLHDPTSSNVFGWDDILPLFSARARGLSMLRHVPARAPRLPGAALDRPAG